MLTAAAGVGMTLIAGEHLFSTFLSSPWTTEKFAETEEDKAKVRKLLWMAVGLSVVTALVMAAILNQWYPLLAVGILCLIYVVVYERALANKI